MNLKEAMELLTSKGYSKYKIAKVMDVGATMIDRYLGGTTKTVRREAADRLLAHFDVEIEDHCINGYQKQMFVDRFNNLDYD